MNEILIVFVFPNMLIDILFGFGILFGKDSNKCCNKGCAPQNIDASFKAHMPVTLVTFVAYVVRMHNNGLEAL